MDKRSVNFSMHSPVKKKVEEIKKRAQTVTVFLEMALWGQKDESIILKHLVATRVRVLLVNAVWITRTSCGQCLLHCADYYVWKVWVLSLHHTVNVVYYLRVRVDQATPTDVACKYRQKVHLPVAATRGHNLIKLGHSWSSLGEEQHYLCHMLPWACIRTASVSFHTAVNCFKLTD